MIVIKELYKNFGNVKALENINLEIKQGEIVVLNGISGSGKSTLLSILASLLKPTCGDVIINDLQIAKLSDYHSSAFRLDTIGFVFQSFHLFDELSVKENVLTPLINQSLTKTKLDSMVKKALNSAQISHKSEQIVKNLSGGEKQRVTIARALINNPDILLCDEPTANLDKENSLKFLDIIESLNQNGKTIIIATHDDLIKNHKIITKVINIENGKIVDK